ncbi:PQQ-binding-like beta-propeller repeat protein [Halosimplex aquaticum]
MVEPSRRRLLAALGAAVGAAGCIGNGDDGGVDTGSPAESPAPSDSPTATPPPTTAASSPTATASPEEPTDTDSDATTAPPTDGSPAVRWSRSYGDALDTRPVVGDGVVYAGSAGGAVRAHDAESGDGWTRDVSEPVQDLALADGTLLALTGSNELGSGQTVVAMDAGSADERWTFGPTSWWLELLAVDGSTIYVATADDQVGGGEETLYAVSLEDGGEQWSATITQPRDATLTDDAVVVSSARRVFSFGRADGSRRWKREIPDDAYGTLAVVADTVVYAETSRDSEPFSVLVGVDAASGEERWRFDEWAVTWTVADGDGLYAGGARTAAVDPETGTADWTVDSPGALTPASLTDDRLYAGGDELRAYTRDDGEQLWTWSPHPPQGVSSPPLAPVAGCTSMRTTTPRSGISTSSPSAPRAATDCGASRTAPNSRT